MELLTEIRWKGETPAYHYKLELCMALSNNVFLADQRSNISNNLNQTKMIEKVV